MSTHFPSNQPAPREGVVPVEGAELCYREIGQAIPGARFSLLKDCEHFSYRECPDEVRKEITGFLQNSSGA